MRLEDAVDAAIWDEFGLRRVSLTTARLMRYSMSRLAAFWPGDSLAKLSPADVAAWVEYERGRNISPITVNSYLRAVKTVMSRLEKMGKIKSNPAQPVPFLKEPPTDPKAISREDYMAMRQAAKHSRDRAILDVLWASGCRLGGLLSMRVDRMQHWKEGERHCYALYVVEKFDRPRWVYVGREQHEGESLAEYLKERPPSADPALFIAMARPFAGIAYQTVQSLMRSLRKAAGIPSHRPAHAHAFRHAFALRMLDEGEDLAAVSSWLGHATPEFTARVYAVRSETALRLKYFKQPAQWQTRNETNTRPARRAKE